ncbi:S-layer homology domain-containing protein [Laspinema olomoucense]|uniref:S-layer homology domain-containing protein n=1 Tax=Laspinema olomoucense D3b TaxID=2953688 RepID=A0ABT2N8G8_9CYAN|nr:MULTISPECIES: S-layer homology domain-containing protein [unclassified Laspinema]MCT7971041.1 S-layer homology domain-containing protein [Laspinema sp. D3d]MCT7978998.1 S-layer homology domain-containing protein [Laspinema sp. D3b]MCT7991394.1 S-layer homology domain-containing protein [Laspinema sp. D3a]MCT7996008.1 S-layer homology domain-containing protein [Laspinema sp. D3c]
MLLKPLSASLTAIALVIGLSACANSPNSQTLERTFAADPLLEENGETPVTPPPPADPALEGVEGSSELPQDFPDTIPSYPNAEFIRTIAPNETPEAPKVDEGVVTLWQTSDSLEQVLNFYQQQFNQPNWEIVPQTNQTESPANLIARYGMDLLVNIDLKPPIGMGENPPQKGEFLISYVRANPTPTTGETPADQPPKTIAIEAATPVSPPASEPSTTSATPTALEKVPEQLRPYLRDLEKMGIAIAQPSGNTSANATESTVDLNQGITRKQFARWLLEVNNKIYANQPGKQVRLAPTTANPAFSDVSTNHPDFPVIQGLAEAGIIPSSLSGDSSATTFRPDAIITREQLLLWKVPLDRRSNLPSASVDAIKESWGFQDASKIDPNALRAVYADYQNGDRSNIRRAFGYTTLFQPKKEVTRAEAAAALWFFGLQGEGLTVPDAMTNPSPVAP